MCPGSAVAGSLASVPVTCRPRTLDTVVTEGAWATLRDQILTLRMV